MREDKRFISSATSHISQVSELGRRVRLELRNPYNGNEEYLNWTWIHGKKKAATDAAISMLVAFLAVLTLIVLIAVFGVWTSAGSLLAAVGLKARTVKEPSDWYVISGT
jgi:hypothetical protein